jgi:hypothetical protein
MRILHLRGTIRRRLLVNFRADPQIVRRFLPQPFRPKLHRGHSLVGICLIRLEQIRPAGVPPIMGFSSDNAAHRIAVEWTDSGGVDREGVFIPRRDTGALLNRLAGGRLFPGEHQPARFYGVDKDGHVEISMDSLDGSVSVTVIGDEADSLPQYSCFGSLAEASSFFEGGRLGYSVTRDSGRLDGVLLRMPVWRVRALSVTYFHSTFFADLQVFPRDSIKFDHALIMRDLQHEWHQAEDLYTLSPQEYSVR